MGPNDQILAAPAQRYNSVPSSSGFAASTTNAAKLFRDALLGPSVAATHLRAQIRRAGPYFRTASLTGEAGCGEEEVARALHSMSPVRNRKFVELRSATAEREFGPGADVRRLMSEGMIYLPEAAQLSVAAQRGLMRALRERKPESARLVAFVGRGLRPMISAGMFSVELANQLGALRVSLPSLRDRSQDLPLLLEGTLRRDAPGVQAGEDFLAAAYAAPWPGNLTQMSEAVSWLAANRAGMLTSEDLEAALGAIREDAEQRSATTRMVRLEQVVQEHVLGVLVGCNGNKLKAAEVLGISRSTLYRMLEGGPTNGVLAMAG